jgi:hypothetical protein
MRGKVWIMGGKVGTMGGEVGIMSGKVVLRAWSHGSSCGKPVLGA